MEEVAKILSCCPATVHNYLKKYKIKIRNGRDLPIHIKNCKKKPIDMNNKKDVNYLIGVSLGDGCIDTIKQGHGEYMRWRFRLKVTNKNFINSVAKSCRRLNLNPLIWKCNSPYYKRHKNWNIPYILTIYNKDFCRYLYSKKNKILSLFKDLEEEEVIYPFLRGLYESEGSFYNSSSKSRFEIYLLNSSNQETIKLVQKLLDKLNINYNTIVASINKKKLKRIYLKGKKKEKIEFLDRLNPCIKTYKDTINQ